MTEKSSAKDSNKPRLTPIEISNLKWLARPSQKPRGPLNHPWVGENRSEAWWKGEDHKGDKGTWLK